MPQEITVLYVDDEQINLLMFEHMFRKKYRILTAGSGFQGLELIMDNPDINVLISDMKMPGMNGIEFIQKAKEHKDDILCFILTGYEITPEIQEALENGLINRYFQKPFNVREIDDSIIDTLNRT